MTIDSAQGAGATRPPSFYVLVTFGDAQAVAELTYRCYRRNVLVTSRNDHRGGVQYMKKRIALLMALAVVGGSVFAGVSTAATTVTKPKIVRVTATDFHFAISLKTF